MLKFTTKKYAFFASCALLSLLLLILSGCDATSDPKVYYQATGSWEGTIKNPIGGTVDQVRGIIAPDGSYHLAVVDANGAFHSEGGEYVGKIGSINPDNIGSMSLTRLQANESSGNPQSITFILSANQLKSDQGIELTRTLEANGPAVLSDVGGRWSLSAADNLTAVVVDVVEEAGILSGGDGQCQYSGSMQLIHPAWNIYRLTLTTADISYLSCPQRDVSYTGLAMKLGKEMTRPRLWFAANSLAKTALGEWSKTINVTPVVQMVILGERADQSVLVQEGATVELDAQGSFDANNDELTYIWSGTAPDGITPLDIQGTGSTVTFVPVRDLDLNKVLTYSLNLVVSDGIETSLPLVRTITVEWTPDRYIGCGNGTVLDTRTNLLWLQDAGCLDLNLDVATNQWGLGAQSAQERVNSLADSLFCGLSDGSVPGDWRLPKVDEFRQIVTETPFTAGPPALLNGQGTGQWIDGDVFVNVGATNVLDNKRYIYWTSEADLDPLAPSNWFFVNFNYDVPENWSESQFAGTLNSLWPVRALRTNPTNPELNEQCTSAPVQ